MKPISTAKVLAAMGRFLVYILLLSVIPSCSKHDEETGAGKDWSAMEKQINSSWLLTEWEVHSKLDGEQFQDTVNNFEGITVTWTITGKDGEYTMSDSPEGTPYIFTFSEGRIVIGNDRRLYEQNEFTISSVTEDTMEWSGHRLDNAYDKYYFDSKVHYLDLHTTLRFKRSL